MTIFTDFCCCTSFYIQLHIFVTARHTDNCAVSLRLAGRWEDLTNEAVDCSIESHGVIFTGVVFFWL